MNANPLIIGAGPTGLAAALFLAERGIRSRIVDKAPAPSATSRAQVLNPRSLELLESTGVVAPMLAEARPIERVIFYDGWKEEARVEFDHAHPRYHMSVLPQARSEALLTEALAARGIRPERGVELLSFSQDEQGVEAVLGHADGSREAVHAPLMYSADGARSAVRRELGIKFKGSGFPEPWPLYDLRLDDPLDKSSAHVSFVRDGLIFLLCIRPGLWRVLGNVAQPLDYLPPGTRLGEVEWQSAFHISDRVAARETMGRVALGGDAAHVHAPVGARGMNLGIEDAFVFAACASDALDGNLSRLDDYGRLRHPVHEKVVGRLDLLTRLARGRPGAFRFLRRYVLPVMTRLSPTAHAMRELLTGLDHEVRVQ